MSEPQITDYLFGKKVIKKRASSLKGPGHQLKLVDREVNDADFAPPLSTFENSARRSTRRTYSTLGPPAPQPIRETAVNMDAKRRIPITRVPEETTEFNAPLYSSFKTGKVVSWGKPKPQPFKEFVLDAQLKMKEATEYTSEVRNGFRPSRTPCRAASVKTRHSDPTATDLHESRADKWLKNRSDSPGPGAYFVP
jgi:hypothetical protein